MLRYFFLGTSSTVTVALFALGVVFYSVAIGNSAIIESSDLHSDIYALFKYFPTVFDDDRKPQNRRYYSTLLELVKLLEGKHICKFS